MHGFGDLRGVRVYCLELLENEGSNRSDSELVIAVIASQSSSTSSDGSEDMFIYTEKREYFRKL
ncbi:hypothetical protein NQ318_010046 [Aromia moschata]|uniref:Uncharacterized protein n=1 Tax=Aromia moschata TaxID=1265417 RepID=A0AAV8YBM8_9CUCU|nr:hypothetical protein NQ318_010046 [Aromia moschata]